MTIQARPPARCGIAIAAVCAFVVSVCEPVARDAGMRVVSLSPAMTEVIYALGAQDHLVGVTTFCTYPPEARAIPKVGDFSNPSIERIVGLKPDLVIVNTPEQRRIKQQLEKLGISVFESSPTTLADIYDEIMAIGIRLGAVPAAESIVACMQANISPQPSRGKRVYVELAPRPLVTIGKETFLNEMLILAGGTNIFSDSHKAYPVVSPEAVIQRDPEIIIVLHPEPFEERIGWENVTAIRNREIHPDLDQDLIMRPGPRLVMGFHVLTEIIGD